LSDKNIIDNRHVSAGRIIPSVTYSDQPYITIADDGAWVCVLTTGSGKEGASGQHIISQRSLDKGKTWRDRVQIEPPEGPEASWVVIAKAPGGRLFAFYTYNIDNLRQIESIDPAFGQRGTGDKIYTTDTTQRSYCHRVDSLGAYVFKFSDNHGISWSAKRYVIPVREFDIDSENITGGEVRFFWNVGRPFFSGTTLFLPIHKVGNFGYGFFTRSEGALISSENLAELDNPGNAEWITLPEGRVGLRAPEGAGPIAEEQSFLEMSDGSLFCVYRTIAGYPACSYSRDRGKNWEKPSFLSRLDGRRLKNPRAANFAWPCGKGRYLYWFHNNGGGRIQEMHSRDASYPYEAPRNPVWLCAGIEVDTGQGKRIEWSEPEIIIYNDDPVVRMSYPDLVIDPTGYYYLTETDKHHARVHRIDDTLLNDMWTVLEGGVIDTPEPVYNFITGKKPTLKSVLLPRFVSRDSDRHDFGSKHHRTGVTLEIKFTLKKMMPGTVLIDTRDKWGLGMVLRVSSDRGMEFTGYDGQTSIALASEPGIIKKEWEHHLAVIVDGGPLIISMVLDGKLLDGADKQQFGWGRFSPNFKGFDNGFTPGEICIGSEPEVDVSMLCLYDRALTTNQAVSRFRKGKK
jgi:hypothetical protein